MRVQVVVKAKDLRDSDMLKTTHDWVSIAKVHRDLWQSDTVDVEIKGSEESLRFPKKMSVVVLRDI